MPLPPPPLRAAFCIAAALILLSLPTRVVAQLGYSGGVVSQNFDTLPNAGEFTFSGKGPYILTDIPLLANGTTGWSLYQNSGTPLRFLPGDGSDDLSSFYSFGGFGGTERALGHISNSGRNARFHWVLRNDSGSTITEFTIAFAGEQWRDGGSGNPNEMRFYHRINSTFPNLTSTAGDQQENALTLFSPVSGGPSGELDGNAPGNRTELSGTISGISWAPSEFLTLRWQDREDPGSDDALAIDDVLFYAPTSAAAPNVATTSPENGASPVLPNAEIKVTFDQPVTATDSWFTLSGSSSGPLTGTASGGPLRFTIVPDAPLPLGETISVQVAAAQITNAGATPMSADYDFTFDTVKPSSILTKIHEVQGSDGVSPLRGAEVSVEGVVIADFQGSFPTAGGFYLQEEDSDADGNPATSEGIFIFDRGLSSPTEVSVGDLVRVTGTVTEYRGITEIPDPTSVSITGTAPLPTPAVLTLPVTSPLDFECCEAMLISIPQTLSVTGSESLGRFGELELSSGGPLYSPTELVDPNDNPASGTSSTGTSNLAAVIAVDQSNRLRTVVLEDGSDAQFPDPTPFLNGDNTRRCGDTVTGLTGILRQVDSEYLINATAPVPFVDANPRPPAPEARTGRVRVASMNVLNYFTGIELPDNRGASTANELVRQREKIVAALAGLDADVVGLIELENNGTTALTDLLNALNAALGSTVYAAVADPTTGSGGDAIRNALLYQTAKVTPIGAAELDTDAIWYGANPLRPPLAQLFQENATGERFIVCVNHFKSKSSTGASGLDLDQGDGQGSYNDLRKQLAARLITFLSDMETSSSESDILIMGDLNAYGEEDPIDVLRAAGWIDQLALSEPGGYSYRREAVSGRLDHALVSPALASKTTGASHWAINADEPAFYDYNTENKSAAQQAINTATPFRSSDHDPVLVDLYPVTFDYWTNFLISWNGADSSAGGDPNFNGLTNLEEFFHGLDPLAPGLDPTFPDITRTGTELELRWLQRKESGTVSAIPQWSTNLMDWYPMNTATIDSILDEVRVQMKATIPHNGETEFFGRLLISVP